MPASYAKRDNGPSIPNSDAEVSQSASFDRYLTSVAEIEKRTGLRFFNHLPQAIADALRAKIDPGIPLWPPGR